MTALSDLIARLEAAKNGSPELGDEVLLACGWKTAPNFDRNNPHPYWIRPDGQNVATNRPNPTTSLDAALALVPKALWIIGHQEDCFARILPQVGDGYIGSKEISVTAHTPALAMCIAALKAREAGR